MPISSDIDLVLPWVNGSDPEWRALRAQYESQYFSGREDFRFRDWSMLKYVFRSIDTNLPWIRKVHFITCGMLPEWLNTECPRLNIVKHDSYIPAQWLPTFSSHTIELNLHRIPGLSEKFVYTNDDIFFLKPMDRTDFFVGDLPASQAGLDIIRDKDLTFIGILNADLNVINRHFPSRKAFGKQFFKFIHTRYRTGDNLRTLILSPWCLYYFPGLHYFHGPNAYLKSTLEDAWACAGDDLERTCSHRFRTHEDVNQYLFLWWQWCKGNFVPADMNRKLTLTRLNKEIEVLTDAIENPQTPILCLNDAASADFQSRKELLNRSLQKVLGKKSSFEL